MLSIDKHLFVRSLDEAYDVLQSTPGSIILGGCGYLRLADRRIGTAIDLSDLPLDQISEANGLIRIGAMTTLRTIETSPITSTRWGGILPKAVGDIVGIQLRNCVTIGGSVAGRYPFSDPICALLALNADVEMHHNGRMSLEQFLDTKPARDILTAVILSGNAAMQAAFASIRRTRTDFAVLNVAVSKKNDEYRVVVGSRPGRAVLVPEAAELLSQRSLDKKTAREAGHLAAEKLQFGDNPRGSSQYRRAICPVLIERALHEVMYAG